MIKEQHVIFSHYVKQRAANFSQVDDFGIDPHLIIDEQIPLVAILNELNISRARYHRHINETIYSSLKQSRHDS